MKRIITTLIILLVLTFTVSGSEENTWWGSNYMPGNFLIKGDLGFEKYNNISSLSFYPEVEIILLKPYFGGISPVDLGLAARGHIGFGSSSNTLDSNLSAGVGVFGTFHFGFRGIGSHFTEYNDSPSGLFTQLNKFDYFFEIGPVFDLLTHDGSGLIGLGMVTGINYFVNDNLAITIEANLWHGFAGGAIGGVYKIGSSPEIRKIDISLDIDLDPLYFQVHLAQFYSIYWYSFYAGGFYFDDSNYKEGQGTSWKLSSGNGKDELVVKKALLKLNSDGSRWWQVKYSSGSDELVYEFLIDNEYKLLKIRFLDEDSGKVREYITTEDDFRAYNSTDMREITKSDYKEWDKGTIEIKTEAGKFTADHLKYEEDKVSYEWWISEEVPGEMIKYEWKDSEETMTGELINITSGNKSELGSF